MAHDTDSGERQKLTTTLVKVMQFHFRELAGTDLSSYTYERRKTSYPQAKAEVSIFDNSGNLVAEGRDFGGGQTSLWLSKSAAQA
jgi:hypothetical protein